MMYSFIKFVFSWRFEVAPEKRWRMTGEKFGFVHVLTDFEVAPEIDGG
jgi:hypothetical protein